MAVCTICIGDYRWTKYNESIDTKSEKMDERYQKKTDKLSSKCLELKKPDTFRKGILPSSGRDKVEDEVDENFWNISNINFVCTLGVQECKNRITLSTLLVDVRNQLLRIVKSPHPVSQHDRSWIKTTSYQQDKNDFCKKISLRLFLRCFLRDYNRIFTHS